MYFTFVMVFILTAILLALDSDFEDIHLDLRAILAPITLGWASIIVIFIIMLAKASKGY